MERGPDAVSDLCLLLEETKFVMLDSTSIDGTITCWLRPFEDRHQTAKSADEILHLLVQMIVFSINRLQVCLPVIMFGP